MAASDDWKLRQIKLNTLLMMADRGFNPDSFDEDDQSILQTDRIAEDRDFVPKIYTNESLATFQPVEQGGIRLAPNDIPVIAVNVVFFGLEPKGKKVSFEEKISKFIIDNKSRFFIEGRKFITVVCNAEPDRTKIAQSTRESIQDATIQTFLIEEVARSHIFYSAYLHFMIPRGSRLNDDQVGQLRDQLGRKGWGLEHLPKMLACDPHAKYHGWIHGDVVVLYNKATNGDLVVDTSIKYRLVQDSGETQYFHY